MKLGEVVLLKTSHRGKIREFITSVSDEKFHTDFGMIEMSELLEKEAGDTVVSHMGQEFVIQLPRMPDFFRHAKRTGAPIMPKDIGMILGYTGINKNDVVLDAGTGSGILAMYLGSIAKRVLSFEIREDFVDVARENIRRAGLENVEVRCGNIVDEIKGLDEKFNAVILDTIDSASVVPHVPSILAPGGFLVTYSPFLEQTGHIRKAIDEADFFEVRTIECIERAMSFSDRGTRPSTSRVGHTGYITIARI
ncbi:tRNA (adenine-N1)-methyltransferase [Methanococcoides methylutens]|uniref:tRNA (adenine-N1)-methyltransferase n=1 Tax=Methanococcoides methylutens TaxID=2226 RepID=UPI00404484BD